VAAARAAGAVTFGSGCPRSSRAMHARCVRSTHPGPAEAASFHSVEADSILDGGRGMGRVG